MKIKTFHFFVMIVLLGVSTISCNQNPQKENATAQHADVILKDYGAEPTVLDIDAYTLSNDNFRIALWTGTSLQLTLMSVPVGGEVGLEQHNDLDQFLRIEEGTATVLMGNTEDELNFTQAVGKDFAIFVPAGKWHNIINTGDAPLKLYSIYAPVEHPHGTVHKTQEEAEEAEHHH